MKIGFGFGHDSRAREPRKQHILFARNLSVSFMVILWSLVCDFRVRARFLMASPPAPRMLQMLQQRGRYLRFDFRTIN